MAIQNTYLDGSNARPNTTAEARALVGRRIEYLRECDIDHSGRGYYFPRVDTIMEVAGRNIRLEGGDWILWKELVEARVLEQTVE